MDLQRIESATSAGQRAESPRAPGKAGAPGPSAFEVTISDAGVKVDASGAPRSGSTPAAEATRQSVAARQVTSRPQFQQLLTVEESQALEKSFGPLAAKRASGEPEGSDPSVETKAAGYDISGRPAPSRGSAIGRLLDLTG